MNIQQIHYILMLASEGSFGKAAEKCFITQSTLSTMVARFESEVEIQVFDRKRKPIGITKSGETIIRQLKVISNELENLKQTVDRLKGRLDVKLSIGAIPTIAPYLFPLFLQDYMGKNTSYKFEISELTTATIIEKICQREIDIGIVSIPLNHDQLEEIHLYDEEFLIYDKGGSFVEGGNIEDIDLSNLWLLEEGHCMRNQVLKMCEIPSKQRLKSNLMYKSGSLGTLLKFVNKNDGITFLPRLATLDLSESELGFLKKFKHPVPARSIGLVVHKHFAKKDLLNELKQVLLTAVSPLLDTNREQKQIFQPF